MKFNRKHGEIWTEFLTVNNGKTRIPKTFIYCEYHGKSGLLDAGGELEWRKNHASCQGREIPKGLPLRGGAYLEIPEGEDEKPKVMRKAA